MNLLKELMYWMNSLHFALSKGRPGSSMVFLISGFKQSMGLARVFTGKEQSCFDNFIRMFTENSACFRKQPSAQSVSSRNSCRSTTMVHLPCSLEKPTMTLQALEESRSHRTNFQICCSSCVRKLISWVLYKHC